MVLSKIFHSKEDHIRHSVKPFIIFHNAESIILGNKFEIHKKVSLWDHSFSTYAKFSEKLHFLPPDTHTCVCVSGGKKC